MPGKLYTAICFFLAALAVFIPAGCSAGQKAEKIVLQLNWFHAPEFIGYYMAEAKGFYREANISLTINEGGPGIAAREYILDGRADFAIASFEEQKKMVEEGRPSVAVMSVFQVPPLVLFALAESGIKEPRDLVGKRVGIKNEYWRGVARRTLSNAGLDPSGIVEVDVPAEGQAMLYEGKVDVWMGYAHDEPVEARIAGKRVNVIYSADYGVGGYEGLLLVNREEVERRPDTIGRFVLASQRGLRYALEHPDEAAEVMMKWKPEKSLEFYRLAIRTLIPLVDIPQSKVGWIDPVRWAQLMGPVYNVENPGYSMRFLENTTASR